MIPLLNVIFSTLLGGFSQFKISKTVSSVGLQGLVQILVYDERSLETQEITQFIVAFVLSCSLLLLLTIQFIIFVVMNYDFHFFKENKYTAFDLRVHFMDYILPVVIIFLKHLPSVLGDEPFTGLRNSIGELPKTISATTPIKIVQNILSLLYSTYGIFNLRVSQNFGDSPTIRSFKVFTYSTLIFESSLGIIMQIDPLFSLYADIDYIFIVVNFLFYKVCSVFVTSYVAKIRSTVFSKIEESNSAFLYMREFLLAYGDREKQEGQLRIH